MPELQTHGLPPAQSGDDRARTVVTGAVDGLCVGVALEAAAAAGDIIRVCIAGYIEGVNATGGAAIAAGDTLAAGAAGIVDTYAAAATDPPVGVALAAEAGNAVTMYWFRKL